MNFQEVHTRLGGQGVDSLVQNNPTCGVFFLVGRGLGEQIILSRKFPEDALPEEKNV